ncbi:hypothetical protein Tco_0976185 [Tanacetum coccineum]|uniref:Uncharacterized protein n=1 Tax=Tanacetum coccineum TaxID=301880 RepID=A0ABQ5EGI2_9ASTR
MSVRVFPDPILFMAGLKPSWEHGQHRLAIIVGRKEISFRNFMYADTNKDLSFLPKEPSLDVGTSLPLASINTEPPITVAGTTEQLVENTANSGGSSRQEKLVIHTGSVARRIKERKCRTKGWICEAARQAKTGARSLLFKVCSSKDFPQADSPFVSISNNDEDATACYLNISAITPPAWNGHLDNQLDLELFDLHDRCYARDQECEELRVKCEACMIYFDKNPAVVAFREKIVTLLGGVKDHRDNLDKMLLESQKWDSYQVSLLALKLKSDDMGKLVAIIVNASIFYGRCHAFKEVAKMKEPFDITKVKGYRYSYKQEHTKTGNDLATATFPYLADVVTDPHAPIVICNLKGLQRQKEAKTVKNRQRSEKKDKDKSKR